MNAQPLRGVPAPTPKKAADHIHAFTVPVTWRYLYETMIGGIIYTGIEATKLRCSYCDEEIERKGGPHGTR